jgi:photosystem II stability/assembly factor-like uncharacterized protein
MNERLILLCNVLFLPSKLVIKITQFFQTPKKIRASYSNGSFHSYIALLTLLAVVFLQPILTTGCASDANAGNKALPVQTNFPRGWNNVAVGGGGYVTGIYLHPQEPNLTYIRTDNGGFFRWNLKDESWVALTDHFPPSEINYYGGEALALDPNNPDVLYIAAGKYLTELGTIFKSTDRGASWVKSDLKVPMGGDEDKRWAGNRLAVSPFDSNKLLFGSRQNGLWRSIDGGMTWTQVKTLQATPDPNIGILAIAFDPQVSDRVYLSVYGDGIYQSTDAGITWIKMESSPSKAMKLAIARDSTLYATSAASPGVSKYMDGVWKDITPREQASHVFNGLSIHPKNSNEVLVSLGEAGSAKIYHSRDGGITWVEKRATINNTVSWWSNKFFSDHTSAIQFDPHVPNRVWLTDWFGIWRTEDINANPAVWTNYEKGHEQTVVFTLVSPPKGPVLLSGIADIDGFYHNRLDIYPTTRFGYEKLGYDFFQDNFFQDTYSIAYCAVKPQHLVRVGGNRWNSTYSGATSKDGGLTWKRFPFFPANTVPLRVAVSATNPKKFVVTVSEGQPLQTSDGGASWRQVVGLPNGFKGPWKWSQPLVADGVNGNRFYYYADGIVYRSDNGGLSFHPVNTSLPKEDWYSIKTIPGIEGEVWVSLDDQGLYRSTDAGKTFSRISQVERAYLFSFGKPPNNSDISVLYLYGTIANEREGLFLSLDWGATWNNISERNTPIGSKPNSIEASKQQFGLVFLGTDGRGIYYHVNKQ